MTHTVRALAFHHKDGYEAQLKLARAFAGEDGRIATMNDIVYARMHSPRNSFVWRNIFITDSKVIAGRDKQGRRLLAFWHPLQISQGPHIVPLWKLHCYQGPGYENVKEHSSFQGLGMEPEEFEKLLRLEWGPVIVANLDEYKNASVRTEKKADNRYTYEEAIKDTVLRAFFGKHADRFIEHYFGMTKHWLSRQKDSDPKDAILFINRLYDLYEKVPHRYASIHPLTIDASGLMTNREKGRRIATGIDFGIATNSGIDDLFMIPYFSVGIRGDGPIISVAPCSRTLEGKIMKHWQIFTRPIAEVPDDPHEGIKPDGSPQKPYYLLHRHGLPIVATGRIKEDGTEAPMPEFRVRRMWRRSPESIVFKKAPYRFKEGFPYDGMWSAVLKQWPEKANAVAFGSSCHSGGNIDAWTGYYNAEIEAEPFHFLTKCGRQFFTQYMNGTKLSKFGRPHRLVEKAEELGRATRLRIPDDVYSAISSECGNMWPVYAHLIAQAPEDANAMWLRNLPCGYVERLHTNVMHADVRYYRVTLGDRAFRPFGEIQADFDWQLERRIEAGLPIS